MKWVRVLKAKNINLEDANKFMEEKLREKGFPSDEELMKEYEEFYKSEKGYERQEAGFGKETFEEFKQNKLREFSDKLYKDEYKPSKRWETYNDEWEEATEDPIENLED